jgi:hypothetical protein
MTITLPPDLAKRFEELARLRGTTAEAEMIHLVETAVETPQVMTKGERLVARLRALATDYGTSLSDAQLSREEMYD